MSPEKSLFLVSFAIPSICIPKEKSKEIQYRSHPYGQGCHCHDEIDETSILDKLQLGILDSETKCTSDLIIPQYRIFTPKLTQANGVKIHLIPSNETFRKTVKEKIQNLVQEMNKVKCIFKEKMAEITPFEKCQYILWRFLNPEVELVW